MSPTSRSEIAAAEQSRRSATIWTWISRVVTVALIVSVLGLTGFYVVTQADTIHSQQSRISDLNEQTSVLIDELAASQDNAQQLYDQLLALPGVEPDGENPDQVVTALPSEPGAPGPRGDAGRPPSANEILGAVGEYCASSGACQGVPGQTGASGATGQPGAPGSAGANGETVIGPQGVQGEPGVAGEQGPAGPAGTSGPVCPEGFEQQVVYVSSDPMIYVPTVALVCAPIPTTPEGEPQ